MIHTLGYSDNADCRPPRQDFLQILDKNSSEGSLRTSGALLNLDLRTLNVSSRHSGSWQGTWRRAMETEANQLSERFTE